MAELTRYETYKPSGIDWIGNYPKHWEFRRLKNVCIVNKEALTDKTPFDYLIEYIDIGNTTDNGDFLELQEIEFSEAPSRARRKVEDGDTIISTVRTYLRAIAFIENPKENLIVSTGFAVLNPIKRTLVPKFLFYQVLCNSFIQRVIANSEGVSYPAISSTKLADLKLFIPSVKEQICIANYLDDQTQKIDQLIANKKAQVEKLKELRQIEVNNAVTKGLNPNTEMKDSGIDWLGKIPKHWKVKRLKNTTFINQSVISEKTAPDYLIKYIDISNVNSMGEFIELQEMEFSEAPSRARRIPKHNSILLSTVRTYLRAIALVQNPDKNLIASTGFAVIDANQNLFNASYLYFQMISHFLVESVIANSEGVSYPAISSTKLGDIKIVIPPINEQAEIANFLQQRTTAIDQLIKNNEAQIEKLQELRKIRIYEAVTGKIKVNAYAEKTA